MKWGAPPRDQGFLVLDQGGGFWPWTKSSCTMWKDDNSRGPPFSLQGQWKEFYVRCKSTWVLIPFSHYYYESWPRDGDQGDRVHMVSHLFFSLPITLLIYCRFQGTGIPFSWPRTGWDSYKEMVAWECLRNPCRPCITLLCYLNMIKSKYSFFNWVKKESMVLELSTHIHTHTHNHGHSWAHLHWGPVSKSESDIRCWSSTWSTSRFLDSEIGIGVRNRFNWM